VELHCGTDVSHSTIHTEFIRRRGVKDQKSKVQCRIFSCGANHPFTACKNKQNDHFLHEFDFVLN
jgi:hypothetical protein